MEFWFGNVLVDNIMYLMDIPGSFLLDSVC